MGIDEAKAIYQTHQVIAALLKMPPLVVSMEEAKAIAQTSGALAEHYGWKPKGPAMLWINFGMTMTAVYAPRMVIMAAYVKAMRANRARPAQPATEPAPATEQPGEPTEGEVMPPDQGPAAAATMEVEGLHRA